MPVKSPYAKFMKHLKTKNPVPIGKRTAMSPINNYLTQMEFKMMLPPKLKDSVRVKGATSEIEFDCVPLMTIALSCLKSHNYEQANCSKEIDEFKNCNKVYQKSLAEAIANEKKGVYKTEEGQRRYPGVLVNKLLQKYKQPRSVDTGPEDMNKQ